MPANRRHGCLRSEIRDSDLHVDSDANLRSVHFRQHSEKRRIRRSWLCLSGALVHPGDQKVDSHGKHTCLRVQRLGLRGEKSQLHGEKVNLHSEKLKLQSEKVKLQSEKLNLHSFCECRCVQ
jgi:hypothetical protein